MEEKEIIKEKVRCKICGSAFTYIRLRDHERVCRTCGYIEDILVENQKNDDKK